MLPNLTPRVWRKFVLHLLKLKLLGMKIQAGFLCNSLKTLEFSCSRVSFVTVVNWPLTKQGPGTQ